MITLANLAVVRAAQGRRHEALDGLDTVLAIRTARLGEYHPDVLGARHCRAAVLAGLGAGEQASTELRSVWQDRVELLGPTHRETRRSAVRLAWPDDPALDDLVRTLDTVRAELGSLD